MAKQLDANAWGTVMEFMDVSSCENLAEVFKNAEEAFGQVVFIVLIQGTLQQHICTSKQEARSFVKKCRSDNKIVKIFNALMQEIPLGALRLNQ